MNEDGLPTHPDIKIDDFSHNGQIQLVRDYFDYVSTAQGFKKEDDFLFRSELK
jgi:lipase chaperone LimK